MCQHLEKDGLGVAKTSKNYLEHATIQMYSTKSYGYLKFSGNQKVILKSIASPGPPGLV